MSASMRNAVQRRNHKERAQPLERKKWGLLEKHKDYSARAKDYKKKQAVLKSLREKAANRNDDEFNYAMLSRGRGATSSSAAGAIDKKTGKVAAGRGNRPLSVEAVRVLKTQDMGHLRVARAMLAREAARVEERLAVAASFAGVPVEDENEDAEDDDDDEDDEGEGHRRAARPRRPRKIVFLDDAEEQARAAMDIDEDSLADSDNSGADDEWGGFDGLADGNDNDADADADADTVPGAESSLQKKHKGDKKAQEDEEEKEKQRRKEQKRKAAHVVALRRKLRVMRARLGALAREEHELELQRARMAKTATSAGVSKAGQKMKVRRRKR